jgi:hypothetical protein
MLFERFLDNIGHFTNREARSSATTITTFVDFTPLPYLVTEIDVLHTAEANILLKQILNSTV